MEMSKYDIFIQVIQNGSLSKTAKKIGYTQSGISHIISSIEQELGCSLLMRSRAGIMLTPEGETLLPYIHSISKSYSNMMECANHLRGLESGTVRISTTQSICTQILPKAISEFRSQYPQVQFKITTGGYSEITQTVLDGTSDFGFICTNDSPDISKLDSCYVLPFTREKMVVIIPQTHPIANESFFPVERLHNEQYIMIVDGDSETHPIFHQHNITPDILFYMRDAYSIMAMVEAGIGISIIPEMSVKRNPYSILAKELSVPAFRSISIIYRKQPNLSHAAKILINSLFHSSIS